MTGRPVQLDLPARRVVIYPPVIWHYLLIAEGDTGLLAVPAYLRRYAQTNVLGRIYPDIVHKPEALSLDGSRPLGAEAILLLQPEVVMTWAWNAADLEAVKYPGLVRLTNAADNQAELYRLFGDLTQKRARVRWLQERYAGQMLALDELLPEAKEPVSMIMVANDNFYVWDGSPFFNAFNQNIRRLKGRNAADNLRLRNNMINLVLRFSAGSGTNGVVSPDGVEIFL